MSSDLVNEAGLGTGDYFVVSAHGELRIEVSSLDEPFPFKLARGIRFEDNVSAAHQPWFSRQTNRCGWRFQTFPTSDIWIDLGGWRFEDGSAGGSGGNLAGTATVAYIPYYAPATIFALLPLIWAWGRWHRRKRQRRGYCSACGYDLRATLNRCPECGTAVKLTSDTVSSSAAFPSTLK